MISKKIIFPAVAVLIIGGATAFGITQVHAQTTNNPFSDLVQKIAQKFGLDQTQVQSVFDDYRNQRKQTMMQNMQKKQEDRLNQLVQNGKITDAQKTAILNEMSVLKSKYNPDNFRNMTPDERKKQFQAEQDEIKTWSQSQSIDPMYLRPGFGIGWPRRMHGKGMGWFNVTPTPNH